MENSGSIILRPGAIKQYLSLANQLGKGDLERFKSITENGCVPLHFAQKGMPDQKIFIFLSGGRLRNLDVGRRISLEAEKIVQEENRKLAGNGVRGDWIDGEKLAVRSIGVYDDMIVLTTSVIMFSQILAMKDSSFDSIAMRSAFKLDTNTHVIASEGEHRLLLVGQRGKRPGDPRMGAQALCAPVGSEVQWTLATNGVVDADIIDGYRTDEIWVRNSFKEFQEELGVEKGSLKYLGLMVDPFKFKGALGIMGVIETSLTPDEIDDARKRARDAVEVPALDAIPLEKEAIATYLRVNRNSMVPQLICGLAVLGFVSWGEDFLRKADR